MRPYVFRCSPHIPSFQDYTESLPEIAEEFPPEIACEIYLADFCKQSTVFPQPKECVAIPRESILCRCGRDIVRTQFACSICLEEQYPEAMPETKDDKKDKTPKMTAKKRAELTRIMKLMEERKEWKT